MKGYIHSVESFGSVDGPGVRFIVFFSGCPLRCAFCHNPDTWDFHKGEEKTAQELIDEALPCRPYWGAHGGLTVSGGEPLAQIDFLLELFTLAKKEGINTCIDTSGAPFTREGPWFETFNALMQVTDLLLMDIKHIDPEKHKQLTAQDNSDIKAFAETLGQRGIDVWIRHVLVPGITDDEESLLALGRFIGGIRSLRALDVLPYHTMGVAKYKEMGIPYRLEGVEPATKQQAAAARDIIFKGIKQRVAEDVRKKKQKQ